TSGMRQQVHQILIDDDQDCIIIKVSLTTPTKGGNEASCHVGYRTCFYREVKVSSNKPELRFIEKDKAFDPALVYEGTANPTKL
ncbi:MAG: phosphoribosyl-AMP cyclohydrolase, partial [Verrucomicrobia bacterium]|nr:phosphoribosyl-AMP cyclohydrolase [Verrucomicrobiota bacterium]